MAGPDLGKRRLGAAGSWRHLCMPLVATHPFGVADLNRERRTERATMAHATDERQFVNLESLAGATTVTQSTATHLSLDLLNSDLKPSRKALNNGDKRLTVGFTGGEQAEHATRLPVTSGQFGLCCCPHHRRVDLNSRPGTTLQCGLVNQHSEPINCCGTCRGRRR